MSEGARQLTARPLTREAFRPFGDVIQLEGSHHYPINDGTTERYHDLARLDLLEQGGRPLLSVFRGQPVADNPVALWLMERHPLASQAFVPLAATRRFLLVVAAPGDAPDPDDLHAFVTRAGQGVNYARGVWHHPLLALEEVSDFLIIDRGGPGRNCDEAPLAGPVRVDY